MTAVAGPPLTVRPGSQFPLGATADEAGTNFAVASGVADGMVLCLFDEAGMETQIQLRDYDAGVWHAFVPRIRPGQAYGYRATPVRRRAVRPAPGLTRRTALHRCHFILTCHTGYLAVTFRLTPGNIQ
jgi:pullulanase/glycogen debranching enzyme